MPDNYKHLRTWKRPHLTPAPSKAFFFRQPQPRTADDALQAAYTVATFNHVGSMDAARALSAIASRMKPTAAEEIQAVAAGCVRQSRASAKFTTIAVDRIAQRIASDEDHVVLHELVPTAPDQSRVIAGLGGNENPFQALLLTCT